MTAMQHVCGWQKCADDERFQVCGDADCGLWRWDPAYSDRAATEAHRKTLEAPRAHVQPISATLGRKTPTGTSATERGPEQ